VVRLTESWKAHDPRITAASHHAEKPVFRLLENIEQEIAFSGKADGKSIPVWGFRHMVIPAPPLNPASGKNRPQQSMYTCIHGATKLADLKF
jgi:hypothetical protein